MNKTQKAEFVDGFNQRIAQAPLLMLADFRGATVAESDAFRRKLESAGVQFQVVKNTLARRAIVDTDKTAISDMLVGMTGIVVSGDDPVAAARVVRDAITEDGKIQVKGAVLEGALLDAAAAVAVADMASREDLLATVLRTMLAAPRQVLGALGAPGRDLVYLLKNYETKLAENPGSE
jgi:large subunit ribosomal protein L10